MGDFLLNFIRFLVAVLLSPLVYGCVVSFYKHLGTYPSVYEDFFRWGQVAFIFTFLFIYQFWGVYEAGQKAMTQIFKFLTPFERMISYLLPFYIVIIFAAFYVTTTFFATNRYDPYFMFFAGFALTMHVLLSAQDMQDQEKTSIKPAYLFNMSGVFILNVFLMVLLLDLILGKFTFPKFAEGMLLVTRYVYVMIFNRIYL